MFDYKSKGLLITLTGSMIAMSALAQQNRQIRGVVFESDGKTPFIGATVTIKGTNTGTITDFNGEYAIDVSVASPILVFRSLGYDEREINIESGNHLNVVMKESSIALDDVVVTALGITREQKSLGYAVSKLASEEITSTVSSNWMSSMAGKVAGLTFDNAGSGPGGSMRVTLRGDQSLNYGNNEALFVIDGVPVSSGSTATVSASNYANADAPIDFGNGASDINPDDIESVSVQIGRASCRERVSSHG